MATDAPKPHSSLDIANTAHLTEWPNYPLPLPADHPHIDGCPGCEIERLVEQLETLRETHDLELDELRMQVVVAENDLREAEAIVTAAREYVGEEPVQLWLNRGHRLVGELADPKWKRLVVAIADTYPASEPLVCECGGKEKGHISFDRSFCACGAMHYYCDDCGIQCEPCDEPSPASEPEGT